MYDVYLDDSFTCGAGNWGWIGVCMNNSYAGTDDEVHEYDYLGAWGPRFDKLADLYGPDLDEQL